MELVKIHNTSFKTFDIVRFPTIDITHIREYKDSFIFLDNPITSVNSPIGNYAHLYVLGDAKPVLFDWVIEFAKNGRKTLVQIDEDNIGDEDFVNSCQPIVASTDENFGSTFISKDTQKLYVDMGGPNQIDLLVFSHPNSSDYMIMKEGVDWTVTAKFKGDLFKVENTLDNRIAFNGLYARCWDKVFNLNRAGGIQLKDVSLLTKDELIDIARILYDESENIIQNKKDVYVDNLREKFVNNNIKATVRVVDYLRYHGYAWEWMGLSVIEQINFGWVVLKLKNK